MWVAVESFNVGLIRSLLWDSPDRGTLQFYLKSDQNILVYFNNI